MSAYHENALKPGTTLADYTIQSVLGHGGFSVTYLAHDAALGADVAIKEYLPQEIAARDNATHFVVPRASKDAIRHYHWGLKNFVKEARALARFKHPNIVRVLRFIEANGTAYTVMEYERGQTLAQYLKEKGQRLDEPTLLRIIMPILNGLHAVHEVGLLHLDIKPENIYLRGDGTPMLIDFGSARHAMTESRPSGRVTLTHGYAPVEQYPDKGKLGPWSDVYAIGATMYRCITGKRPDDALERYRAVLSYQTDPLRPVTRAAASRFQPVLLECIERAMQIHAQDRPQSARELQDYLLGRSKLPRAAGAAVAVTGKKAGGRGNWRARLAAGMTRLVAYFIAAVLLAGAGLGGWFAWPHLVFMWEKLSEPSADVSVRAPQSRRAPEMPIPAEVRRRSASPPTTVARVETKPETSERPSNAPPADLRAELAGHSDWVQALAFAPQGGRLATASNDRTIRIWDVAAQDPVAVFQQEHAANAVGFSPDGRQLAAAGVDGVVHVWDVARANRTARLAATGYPLFAVAYAPDGRTLAAAGKDRLVYVWSVVDASQRVFEGHTGGVNALAFRPGTKTLVSAGDDRLLRVWDVETGQETASLTGHKDAILALAFSRNGHWLASGDAGHTIRVWDMRTRTHLHTLTDVAQAVLSLAFAPNGAWLAAGAADNTIYLFDMESGRLVQTLNGHRDYVQALAVSPDGRLLASGSRDRAVRLWQAP